MRDFRDAKTMAQSLRTAQDDRSITISHSDALELISRSFGFDNWNILAAKIEAAAHPPLELNGKPTAFCSFCGKSQHEVAKIIAGPDVFICDDCVGLCDAIIDETHIAGLAKMDREQSPGDPSYPALTAFLASRTAEQRAKIIASTQRSLDLVRWSMAETARALGETPPPAPPSPPRRAKTPVDQMSREELLTHRAWLEGQLADGLAALGVANRVQGETA
jgi:hypothetical protein